MTVIDIHTHMLPLDWVELLRRHGGDMYEVKARRIAGANAERVFRL